MFDELAELGLHDGDPHERELLWAACMLHDIGMSIDYDDHHKHSRYLILNSGLPGFTPVETAIIAQSARYHRKGMPAPGPMSALFGAGGRRAAGPLAVLLRLAEDLERSRDQLVRCTEITLHDGEVELRLLADGESAVPRWAAGREGELFAAPFTARCPSRPSRAGDAQAAASAASAAGAVEQHAAVGDRRPGCATRRGVSSLHAAQHRLRGEVAAARRVVAAEQHVARLAVAPTSCASDGPSSAGSVPL